ncbi:MAG: hypothetical protein HXX09_07075 [Bacteroidetes bacterium]|nr:hypothetical protein [Bacteroidota bacterium]
MENRTYPKLKLKADCNILSYHCGKCNDILEWKNNNCENCTDRKTEVAKTKNNFDIDSTIWENQPLVFF